MLILYCEISIEIIGNFIIIRFFAYLFMKLLEFEKNYIIFFMKSLLKINLKKLIVYSSLNFINYTDFHRIISKGQKSKMELLNKIKIIKTSNNPIPFVHQFVQEAREISKTKYSIDFPKTLLLRIIKSLTTKNENNRATMSFLLSQITHVLSNDFNMTIDDLYEISIELELGTDTVELRHNVIAVFITWTVFARCGLFNNNEALLLKVIRNIHGYSNERLSLRNFGYNVLWEIVISCCKKVETFKKTLYKELVNEIGINDKLPKHADSYDFWLKVFIKYPELGQPQWVKSPTASTILRTFASVLEQTSELLPQIHSLWFTLAEINAIQLVMNVVTNWKDEKNNFVPYMAIMASFPHSDPKRYIHIFHVGKDYIKGVIPTFPEKYVTTFTYEALRVASLITEIHPHRIIDIYTCVITCLSSKAVSKHIAKLNDEQIREIMSRIENDTFESHLELLWAQARRINSEDNSLLVDLFNKTIEKATEETQKNVLLTFLSYSVRHITGDGRNIFILLSGKDVTLKLNQGVTDVINQCKLICETSAHFHKRLGIECSEIEVSDFDSLINKSIELSKNKCELCSSIGNYFGILAIKFMNEKQLELFADNPLILVSSLNNPSLFAKGINILLELFSNRKKLPRNLQINKEKYLEENITFDECQSEATLLAIINNRPKPNSFLNVFTKVLFTKLTEDSLKRVLLVLINSCIGNSSSESEIFKSYLSLGANACKLALDTFLSFDLGENDKSHIHRIFLNWINTICERVSEYDVDTIGKLFNKYIILPEGDTRSSKQKQEDSLEYLEKFLRREQKKIPLFELEDKIKNLENSQSNRVKKSVKYIVGFYSRDI